ncbi:hypothetical protein OA90_24515 [Labrenzia sp. OB1]|nr:hypothetical protein OA90_24515 [Labrenzia sp. OB1]
MKKTGRIERKIIASLYDKTRSLPYSHERRGNGRFVSCDVIPSVRFIFDALADVSRKQTKNPAA